MKEVTKKKLFIVFYILLAVLLLLFILFINLRYENSRLSWLVLVFLIFVGIEVVYFFIELLSRKFRKETELE